MKNFFIKLIRFISFPIWIILVLFILFAMLCMYIIGGYIIWMRYGVKKIMSMPLGQVLEDIENLDVFTIKFKRGSK